MSLFDGMETFARVVETGGITAAAAQLGVAKSSVSDQVRRLEERLGARLLDRTTRRLSPTEAGQAFYARCRQAIEQAAAARSEARALHVEPSGVLRVASPEAFPHIAPVVVKMLDEHPGLQVQLVEGAGAVDLIEAGIDVAIRVSPQPAENLIVRRIGTSRPVVVAAPAYLERHGVPAAPQEAAEHRCVGFSPLFWGREWRFLGPDGPLSVPIRPALATNSTATLRIAALAGVGLVALPEWVIGDELKSGAVTRVLGDWTLPESGIFAVYPSNRLMATKVRTFVDRLARHLKGAGL